MRTKKSFLNSISGFISISIGILFSFITRIVFVRYLSQDYLGYNALFSNIISVLSVAELGIGEAIAFSLFKPISQEDYPKVAAIMSLFKKIYVFIGVIIGIISLLLSSAIHFFINTPSQNIGEIRIFFLLYACSTVISYFFSYQRTLFYATQNSYIVNIIDCSFKIILNVAQITLIVITRNYVVYLIVMILCTFVNNLFIYYFGNKKLYKYIKQSNKLSANEIRSIFKQVKSLSITRICTIGITSTDNIYISKFTNLALLGIYSNYSLIISSIQTLLVTTLNGVKASIGDLVSSEDNKKLYEIFELNNFIHYIASSFSAICIISLVNNFIQLIFGKTYVLGMNTVIIISLNLYFYVIQQSIWQLISTAGLFSQYKNINIAQLIVNIILSFCFGLIFGLNGVIGSTLICYITSMILAASVIYKHLFKDMSLKTYFIKQFLYFVFTIFIITISKLISYFIYHGNIIIIDMMIEGIVLSTLFVLVNYLLFDRAQIFGKKYFRIIYSKLKGGKA